MFAPIVLLITERKVNNGGWFIFGEAEKHSCYPYVIAIHRMYSSHC